MAEGDRCRARLDQKTGVCKCGGEFIRANILSKLRGDNPGCRVKFQTKF